jgi:hypothetical protein
MVVLANYVTYVTQVTLVTSLAITLVEYGISRGVTLLLK